MSSLYERFCEGILPDDKWQVIPEITVKNGYQKGNAKVVIKITGEQKSIG